VIFHFLIGIFGYMGREWELCYRPRHCAPGFLCRLQPPLVAAAIGCLPDLPFGQGSFLTAMPLGISGTFNFMLVFQASTTS